MEDEAIDPRTSADGPGSHMNDGVHSSPSSEKLDPKAIDFELWKEWKEWKEWEEWTEWVASRTRERVATPPPPLTQPTTSTQFMEAEDGRTSPTMQNKTYRSTQDAPGQPEVRYVLSGQPTGWAAMAQVMRDLDEEKVKDCKEDIDTLLVFAGLFSAILSAFIIFALPDLQSMPDTSLTMLTTLERIANQTVSYTFNMGILNTTTIVQPIPPPTSSDPTTNSIRVNNLWFASLLLSLMAASFSILVKQWLREYLAVQNPSPQARLRARHLRFPQLAKWMVFEIAAILPLLLQISLLLFFVGMWFFTDAVHSSVGHTTLSLVLAWATCFSAFSLLPFAAPQCPYRTPLLKASTQLWFRILSSSVARLAKFCYDESWNTSGNVGHLWRLLNHFLWRFNRYLQFNDELETVKRATADVEILADADTVQSNDELLRTTIPDIFAQTPPSPEQLRTFILSVLQNRLNLPSRAWCDALPFMDLSVLSSAACNTIVDLISQHLQATDLLTFEGNEHSQASFFIVLMSLHLGRPNHKTTRSGLEVLTKHLDANGSATCTAIIQAIQFDHSYLTWKPEDDCVYVLLGSLTSLLDVVQMDLHRCMENLEAVLRAYLDQASRHDDDLDSLDNTNPSSPTSAMPVLPLPFTQASASHWPFDKVSQHCRSAAIDYLLAAVDLSFRTDGDPVNSQWAKSREAEKHREACVLLLYLSDGVDCLSYFILKENRDHKAWGSLLHHLDHADSASLFLDALVSIEYGALCCDLAADHFRQLSYGIQHASDSVSSRRLSNLAHAVTQEIHSASEVPISSSRLLKLCFVAISFVHEDFEISRTHRATWRTIFHNLADSARKIIQTMGPSDKTLEASDETAVGDLTTLADRSFGIIKRKEFIRTYNPWENPDSTIDDVEWHNSFRLGDTIFEPHFVDVLASFCASTSQWTNHWRIRLARDQLVAEGHQEADDGRSASSSEDMLEHSRSEIPYTSYNGGTSDGNNNEEEERDAPEPYGGDYLNC